MGDRPRRKKKSRTDPTEIKSKFFNHEDDLTEEDLDNLRADSIGEAFDLFVPNWRGKLIGFLALIVKPDNSGLEDAQLVLKGDMFSDNPKLLGASKFFEVNSPLQLVIESLDCAKFVFNNSMVSDYLDSSQVQFQFRKDRNSPAISAAEALAAGFRGFTVRAFVQPTAEARLKISVSLYPSSLTELLDQNPLAATPYFPGISLGFLTFPFAPKCREIFAEGSYGLPVFPALISESPFMTGAPHPSTSQIITAVAAVLRNVHIPNSSLTRANLLPIWETLKTSGELGLKITKPDLVWPKPQNDESENEGRPFLLIVVSLCALHEIFVSIVSPDFISSE